MNKNLTKDQQIISLSKRKISRKIYCRFSSKQSILKTFSTHKQQKDQLRKTNESSPSIDLGLNNKTPSVQQDSLIPMSPLLKSISRHACIECNKNLGFHGFQTELYCHDCQIKLKVLQNPFFAQFIHFVYDFKIGFQNSYISKSKVQRIESIDSCFSYTNDKLSQSSKGNQFRTFGNNRYPQKILNSIENRKQNLTKVIDQVDKQTLGGYFCDECDQSPIIGQRYHCEDCHDFDLCEKCYYYVGHKHAMKTIGLLSNVTSKKKSDIKQAILKNSQNLRNNSQYMSSSIRKLDNLSKMWQTTKLSRK